MLIDTFKSFIEEIFVLYKFELKSTVQYSDTLITEVMKFFHF
jgi:hypothetical protein